MLGLALVLGVMTACSGSGEKPQTDTPAVQGRENAQSEAPAVKDLGIQHEEEFGGAYALMTIDDFNALGFEYGDSVNVEFSNGYKLEALPYYNGYYTKNGEPLLVAYTGYPYIKLCIKSGDDLFTAAGLAQDDTVNITLAEKAAYLPI